MIMVCIVCEQQFTLLADHVGYANKCPQHNKKHDVERCGAKIYWEGKHTPVIEVVPSLKAARKHNAKSRRLGASVTACLVPRPDNEWRKGDAPAKEPHANNPGSAYTTPLGEKHTTRR